ncbi:hypothetical protein [Bradyrhizobium sp. BWA-3-5]|uniref:hypothetical protein n=1 Tax=Bradyrhizobium sp. BWA-3-5 TaxID=3080013 RepID=UPI00293F4AFA|nr:hypothetical protein [Bradyrhizobium sp. BWA-3-5]WOH64452.1 hypothetical protein RX331_28465 [Bradyrhizobium sp. BWA-3-5]
MDSSIRLDQSRSGRIELFGNRSRTLKTTAIDRSAFSDLQAEDRPESCMESTTQPESRFALGVFGYNTL